VEFLAAITQFEPRQQAAQETNTGEKFVLHVPSVRRIVRGAK
jgi:hypothetical protein